MNILDNNSLSKLKIGSFCSIAPKVTFILNSDHYTNNLSSFPFKVMCLGSHKSEAISYGDIVVDDDVWIGYGATILSGIHVGQGAIIAAGAVVSKDVPPYAIVGGVPARIINSSFPDKKFK
ncbi:MAG: CatB-related O-acetyltransferase [Succinivibrio dextrinosolvens]|nr:CatB-related O-acetyltransferase [Succinivibrio dextrinosolvens]